MLINKYKTSELTSKVLNGEEITINFNFPDNEIMLLINSLVSKILSRINKIFYLDTILTILREMLLNAIKANAKRLFFSKRNFDICNSQDYKNGIIEFKKNVVGKIELMKSELEKSEYEIIFKMKMIDNSLEFKIINNATLTTEELDRIDLRVTAAENADSFTEAYEHVHDDSEGAGLGIVLSILLLRNAGIDSRYFMIKKDKKTVTSSLYLPHRHTSYEKISSIKKTIISEIEHLPTFPENITELQAMCNDSSVSIDEISSKIITDPSLTADLLKISNSAGFITSRRIENINEAIMTIGLNNLIAILTAAAARKIMDSKYKKFGQIWNHCNRVAFYSRFIALETDMSFYAEKAFISGILHDIGKIVLLSITPDLACQLSSIAQSKKIRSSTILEEISIGISHATIGSIIAEKWNFPDYLLDAIKNHHSPLNSKNEFKQVTSIVYLANMLCEIERQRYNFDFIETEVLDIFNFSSENKLLQLHEKLSAQYDRHSSFI